MTPTLESLGIDRMSADERLALAEAIWDSIAPETRLALLRGKESIHFDQGDAHALARMISDHRLNPDEIVRLLQVFRDYPPESHKQELEEELRCVLAARELAKRPKLTAETADKAREAFASGRVLFVPQDMD